MYGGKINENCFPPAALSASGKMGIISARTSMAPLFDGQR